MIINESEIVSLWFENSQGERFVPNYDNNNYTPPPGFIYQHSFNAHELTHKCFKAVLQSEVDACLHTNVTPIYGWVPGIEGRECAVCHGTQTRNIKNSWPPKWDAHGSRKVFVGNSSYSADLVMGMVNPYLKQWIKSLFRNNSKPPKKYPLHKAIIIVANSCERCLNYLYFKYGFDDGYPEKSDKWWRAGTRCEFCKHLPMKLSTPESRMKDLLT